MGDIELVFMVIGCVDRLVFMVSGCCLAGVYDHSVGVGSVGVLPG